MDGVILVNLFSVHNNDGYTAPCAKFSAAASRRILPAITHNIWVINNDFEQSKDKDWKELDDFRKTDSSLSYEVHHFSHSLGAEGARKELLKFLDMYLKNTPIVQEAAAHGTLFWQFLDCDDLVHPDLFFVMLHCALEHDAWIVDGEHTIRKFNKLNEHIVKEGVSVRCSLDDFKIVNDGDGVDNASSLYVSDTTDLFSLDGRMPFSVTNASSYGYLPVLFRYNAEYFKILLEHNLSADLADMIMYYAGKLYSHYDEKDSSLPIKLPPLVPKDGQVLYFYRQHDRSMEHDISKASIEQILSMVRSQGPNRLSYIRHLIDCDMIALNTAFKAIIEKFPSNAESILQFLSEITSEYARRESTSK
ncbi:hypothetical protein FACS1894122_10810 [Alphaproteobacteria bacterium]|nr:hypothetical protein FACS1894122_10810 [Alphaproteobacteria bacterium]